MGNVKAILKKSPLVLLLLALVFLRLVNLGYSEYQGDEIQALYLPKSGQTLPQFLLDQKKGPIQYLVTASVKGLSNNYDNAFLTRLPFSLAGIVAGVMLYLLVKSALDKGTALLALLFYSTNGLFVAFSRIVQYQTLVALFVTASLYMAQRLYSTGKTRYLYYSVGMWGLGLLTHSDAMFIAFPLLAFYILWARKNSLSFKRFLSRIFPPFIVLDLVLLGYYIPLILNASAHTQNYWLGRFSGDITSGIISSAYLFSVYQPIYGLQIYKIVGLLGLIAFVFKLIYRSKALFFLTSKFRFRFVPVVQQDGHDDFMIIQLGLLFWFGSALVFMELLTKFPGTHVWTYLLPLFIFMGHGLNQFYILIKPLFIKYVYITLVLILVLFLGYQSYAIFIDHGKEYPWERKPFLVWELKKPNTGYQLSLFGFPYYRGWKDLANFFVTDGQSGYYWDNEKASLSRYYIPLIRDNKKAGYFIRINRPQTFTSEIINKRGAGWAVLNQPVKVFYNKDGRQVAMVYLVPETWGQQ